MPSFTHEKLEVYQLSKKFVILADFLVGQLPKGRYYIADQFLRAATSISLNIAEGAGEFSRNEKARFYRMAKRSTTECAAIVDICKDLGLIDDQNFAKCRDLMFQLVSILTALSRNFQENVKEEIKQIL